MYIPSAVLAMYKLTTIPHKLSDWMDDFGIDIVKVYIHIHSVYVLCMLSCVHIV